MKKATTVIVLAALFALSFKADKPAYLLYDSAGKSVKYQKMISAITKADVVFFGELHDNPVSHWLEYEVTADLHKSAGENLILGAEMFEADSQLLIDEYLEARYEADKFEAEVKLWKNYKTDYKPLMEFARENRLPFIATNVPRRYASMVSRRGLETLDSLTAEAKQYIAPLPIEYDPEVKSYKGMISMFEMPGMGGKMNENLPKAQAIKDATMAHFIAENLTPGKVMIHYNGAYHSDNYSGIIHYLSLYRPGLKIVTITTALQESVTALDDEHKGKADYIIAVPVTMTRTY